MGSAPILISLDGVIVPTAVGVNVFVVGSVPITVAPVGVIALATPGVKAVVGSVDLQVTPAGVINFTAPSVLSVVGSVGVAVKPAGVISEPVFIHACIGSVKLGVGVKGVVGEAFPTAPPVLAITGSVRIGINATGVVGGIAPSTLSVIGSVEIRIGEFRVPELTVVQLLSPGALTLAITGSAGVEVGPAGVIALVTPPIYAVPLPQAIEGATINIAVAGVIAFISPQILEVIGDIEVGISGGVIDPGVFDTYTLCGSRGEPSIYSNFNFNSYARYRNQSYGAGMEGIYLLEGPDDDGKEIIPGIKIGPVNFGSDREKRIRLLRLGGNADGAQVKVSSNGDADYSDVIDGRAAVSRSVQGRELLIEISGFTTLDHLELVPLILAKR